MKLVGDYQCSVVPNWIPGDPIFIAGKTLVVRDILRARGPDEMAVLVVEPD
jgi:hypothetical protein